MTATRTVSWRSDGPRSHRWVADGPGGRRYRCVRQNTATGAPRWKAYVTTGLGVEYLAGKTDRLSEAKALCENWTNPDSPSNR